jgi:hypothetical protein
MDGVGGVDQENRAWRVSADSFQDTGREQASEQRPLPAVHDYEIRFLLERRCDDFFRDATHRYSGLPRDTIAFHRESCGDKISHLALSFGENPIHLELRHQLLPSVATVQFARIAPENRERGHMKDNEPGAVSFS